MMKIGLIDVDGHNFPNLPLMKLSAWHKLQGDDVEWYEPMWGGHYDVVYMSKVFGFTRDYPYHINADKIIKGGTGYQIKLIDGKEVYEKQGDTQLPAGVEHICPDYTLYPERSEAYGFLTRGCPRGCPFCIVAAKEGRKSVQTADLDEFYRGQKIIKLMDPNITACEDRERLFQQLIDSRAKVDFTQGLDIRFVRGIESLILKVRVEMLHFAWDNPKEDLTAEFIKFKERSKLRERKLRCYVLTNYWSTHEEDLERVYTLRKIGYDPYIMIYDKEHAPRKTRMIQRWVNNKFIFRTVERFEDYDPKVE